MQGQGNQLWSAKSPALCLLMIQSGLQFMNHNCLYQLLLLLRPTPRLHKEFSVSKIEYRNFKATASQNKWKNNPKSSSKKQEDISSCHRMWPPYIPEMSNYVHIAQIHFRLVCSFRGTALFTKITPVNATGIHQWNSNIITLFLTGTWLRTWAQDNRKRVW